MTMQSSNLLPALRELPGGDSGQGRSFRDHITGIVSMDRAMYAAEFATAVSGGMWGIFDSVNIEDDVRENLTQAHELAFPEYDGTLTEHWQEVMQKGPFAMRHFVGEIETGSSYVTVANELEQQDFTSISDSDLTQPISAIGPGGQEASIQIIADPDYANADEHLDLVITQAFEMSSSTIAETHSVVARWQMVDQEKFINNTIGKVAEIQAREQWGQIEGITGVDFVRGENGLPNPSFEGPDLTALGPQGQEMVSQVKFGGADYVNDHKVVEWVDQMRDDPNKFMHVSEEMYGPLADSNSEIAERIFEVGSSDELREQIRERLDLLSENPVDLFAVGSETYRDIIGAAPGMDAELITIDTDFLQVEGITDGLETLTGNLGIDIPDSFVEIIPFAPAIFASARLIAGAVKTEKEFKGADRTTKNKIQVVQTLALIGKFGPKTLMATIGGKGGVEIGGAVGTLAGSVVPGVGNAVGGAVGSVGGGILGIGTGMWIGRYLGKRLQPHMLNLALNITGLTNDDLFYYKNKPRIDAVALSFQSTAKELATAPA